MKIYVVKKGRKKGIYSTWDECKKQVDGFSGAIYKSFISMEDALKYMGEKQMQILKKKAKKKGYRTVSKTKSKSNNNYRRLKNSKSGKIYMAIGRA